MNIFGKVVRYVISVYDTFTDLSWNRSKLFSKIFSFSLFTYFEQFGWNCTFLLFQRPKGKDNNLALGLANASNKLLHKWISPSYLMQIDLHFLPRQHNLRTADSYPPNGRMVDLSLPINIDVPKECYGRWFRAPSWIEFNIFNRNQRWYPYFFTYPGVEFLNAHSKTDVDPCKGCAGSHKACYKWWLRIFKRPM